MFSNVVLWILEFKVNTVLEWERYLWVLSEELNFHYTSFYLRLMQQVCLRFFSQFIFFHPVFKCHFYANEVDSHSYA